jgi:hypothetical protein
MSKKITVMQPYFFPYLDYFRLPYVSDFFVLLDDVQFSRRGYVHRNKFTNRKNELDWLTLSIVKGDQKTTKISTLEFSKEANQILHNKSQNFKVFINNADNQLVKNNVFNCNGSVVDYLESGIFAIMKMLQIQVSCIRSSQIPNNKKLSGTERIIQIVKELEGNTYVNSPGGRDIYKVENFKKEHIKLEFLPDTENKKSSCLERFLTENHTNLIEEIKKSVNL